MSGTRCVFGYCEHPLLTVIIDGLFHFVIEFVKFALLLLLSFWVAIGMFHWWVTNNSPVVDIFSEQTAIQTGHNKTARREDQESSPSGSPNYLTEHSENIQKFPVTSSSQIPYSRPPAHPIDIPAIYEELRQRQNQIDAQNNEFANLGSDGNLTDNVRRFNFVAAGSIQQPRGSQWPPSVYRIRIQPTGSIPRNGENAIVPIYTVVTPVVNVTSMTPLTATQTYNNVIAPTSTAYSTPPGIDARAAEQSRQVPPINPVSSSLESKTAISKAIRYDNIPHSTASSRQSLEPTAALTTQVPKSSPALAITTSNYDVNNGQTESPVQQPSGQLNIRLSAHFISPEPSPYVRPQAKVCGCRNPKCKNRRM